MNPKKILITEYNCIGDAILITPAINLIKEKYPNAEIHLLVIPAIKETIDATNLVDKTFSIKIPWHNKFSLRNWKQTFKLIKKMRKENYDLAIDFNGDIRDNYFLWKVKSKFTLGFDATGGDFLINTFSEFSIS